MNKSPISARAAAPFVQTYFHGTKADLQIGDLIKPGFQTNYDPQKNAPYIFLSATLDAAIWAADLSQGTGKERIYLVEATGRLEDDPDLTNKTFPGNPTQSYRSAEPFKIVGEVSHWQGHAPEQVEAMKEQLNKLSQQGVRSLNVRD